MDADAAVQGGGGGKQRGEVDADAAVLEEDEEVVEEEVVEEDAVEEDAVEERVEEEGAKRCESCENKRTVDNHAGSIVHRVVLSSF